MIRIAAAALAAERTTSVTRPLRTVIRTASSPLANSTSPFHIRAASANSASSFASAGVSRRSPFIIA
jgi:hypothetical protein